MNDAPVALFIFNRPDLTAQVFNAIRQARPRSLFVISDAPRAGRAGEADKCAQARAITEAVDWPCKVFRNYAEQNMGCGRRISSGISWVFETADRCIFLEDDCLPDNSFFAYCGELLERYDDDPRVGFVCGSNLFGNAPHGGASYFFARQPMVWGWASWRRVWKDYDFKLTDWPRLKAEGWLGDAVPPGARKHWNRVFDSMAAGKIDTWDYQLAYLSFRKAYLTILPRTNLISNLGFRSDATHTTRKSRDANLDGKPLSFPLIHTAEFTPRLDFEESYLTHHVAISPLTRFRLALAKGIMGAR